MPTIDECKGKGRQIFRLLFVRVETHGNLTCLDAGCLGNQLVWGSGCFVFILTFELCHCCNSWPQCLPGDNLMFSRDFTIHHQQTTSSPLLNHHVISRWSPADHRVITNWPPNDHLLFNSLSPTDRLPTIRWLSANRQLITWSHIVDHNLITYRTPTNQQQHLVAQSPTDQWPITS